jgi:hypothetical protein
MAIIVGVLLLAGGSARAQETDATETDASAATIEAAPAEPSAGPDIVKVGAYINDIQQLDLQSHSYNVDLYVWFKWTNPEINPATTLEFMNSFELWGHILTFESEEPEVLEDGTLYMALRNQGKFNTKLPLETYPFDRQVLSVEMESTTYDSGALVFVPDDEPIASNPDMTLPGYVLGAPNLIVIDKTYASSFGAASGGTPPSYSRIVVELPVTRPALTYAMKIFLPMIMVLITASLMFFVNPSYVDGRIGIGITTLLTLVALEITTNSDLPEVDYLMLIDKVYMAGYAFVVTGLALVVRASRTVDEIDMAVARRTDRRHLAVLTAAFVGIVTVLVIEALARS